MSLCNLQILTAVARKGSFAAVAEHLGLDGIDQDDFIKRNADPIWLHQNEMWEYIDSEGQRKSMVASRWKAPRGDFNRKGSFI